MKKKGFRAVDFLNVKNFYLKCFIAQRIFFFQYGKLPLADFVRITGGMKNE